MDLNGELVVANGVLKEGNNLMVVALRKGHKEGSLHIVINNIHHNIGHSPNMVVAFHIVNLLEVDILPSFQVDFTNIIMEVDDDDHHHHLLSFK